MLNNPTEILKQDTSDASILSLRIDDIITLELKEGESIQTLESMKKDFEIFKKWTKNKKLGFLVDSRSMKKFDTEQRVYAQKNSPLFSNKYAIIISSGTSSFIANMFIYLTKPEIPTKIFTTKEDAIKWLKE
jgi:hypothetical protein